jgi:alpha-tubulin suppressor-like RCC1 family protein
MLLHITFCKVDMPVDRQSSCIGTKVVQIAAGAEHSLAVSAAGELFTWGNGTRGCLGDTQRPLH